MENKILVVALFGLLLATGLILAGCAESGCPGNAECTVTIRQGVHGLFICTESPRSSCGNTGTWNWESNSFTGGCQVANIMSMHGFRIMRYGTHNCNC